MLKAVPIPPRADETLARAQAGDQTAFAAILREHQSMVFGLAYHVVRDRTVAEDLAQEVFLDLYRNLGNLESSAHLRFWLRRVTSHRCIDRGRRERRRLEIAVEHVPDQAVPSSGRDFLFEERIRRLVAELPVGARTVMTLRYQEDLEPSEIADTLDMPVNTVKSHLRRSIALLRERLIRQGGLL
jgi:RNA polymerase sigma-70 factor (ECF subfamily)